MASRLKPLERSIVAAVAFHDAMDFPLTLDEVRRWLYAESDAERTAAASATVEDIQRALAAPPLRVRLTRAGEFVTLAGRQGIVIQRHDRRAANERKRQRAAAAARIVRWLPFVRGVFLVNTAAIGNARPESDIDVLIVVRDGRLWIARLLATAVLQLLRRRHHGRSVRDRICLSFFLTESALDVGGFRLPGGDPYLAFWTTRVVPVLDLDGVTAKFRVANRWVNACLPNGFLDQPPLVTDDRWARVKRRWWEWVMAGWFGHWLERVVRRPQEALIRRNATAERPTSQTDVVVSESVMKLHLTDRREWFRQQFYDRLHATENRPS